MAKTKKQKTSKDGGSQSFLARDRASTKILVEDGGVDAIQRGTKRAVQETSAWKPWERVRKIKQYQTAELEKMKYFDKGDVWRNNDEVCAGKEAKAFHNPKQFM